MPDQKLTDKEAAERFRKAQRQNRDYQRKHRRAMETAGYKRVTGFLSPTAHEILNRLKREENANVGQALSMALERLVEREKEVAELEKQRREWVSQTFGEDDQRLTDKEPEHDQALTGKIPDDDQNLIDKTPENDRETSGNFRNADQMLTGKTDEKADPSEIVERVRDMDKDSSRKEVAARLNSEGYRTSRGAKWTASKLNAFLQRQKKKGTE